MHKFYLDAEEEFYVTRTCSCSGSHCYAYQHVLLSLEKARRSGKNGVCTSNLAQITRGALAFSKQNDNKFWTRGKNIKPTHIGRDGNGGQHEFNIYDDFVNRELYSCPLAP